MRYLVLFWTSPLLSDYRKGGWFDDPDQAALHAARLWSRSYVRLSLVVAVREKQFKRSIDPEAAAARMELEELLRDAQEAPYAIPRFLKG